MAVDTYYFDGHNGISDPDGVWSNDSLAFNNDPIDYASTNVLGSTTLNYLGGFGTSITGSESGSISGVTVFSPNYIFTDPWKAAIYSSGEFLGDIFSYDDSTPTAIAAPTGGWTWAKVENLEVRFCGYETLDPGFEFFGVGQLTLEVTHVPAPANSSNFFDFF